MSDRDRFAGLAQQWLQNEELTPPDRQFVIDYLMRYMRGQQIVINSLPDVLEWDFTGDNIIFSTIEMILQSGYLEIEYDWKSIGSIDDSDTDTFVAVATDDTYVYVGSSSFIYDYAVYRYTIATEIWEGLLTPTQIGVSAVSDLALDSSGNLYIAPANDTGIYKWDGSTVTHLTGTDGGQTLAAQILGINGTDMYCANNLYVFHYDLGTDTTTLVGTGNASRPYGIAFDSSDNVYFAAGWTTIGGETVNYVAKYSGGAGGSWSALGSGLSATCYSIAVDGSDNVWVGNGVDNAELNKWDGTQWTSYNEVDASGVIYGLAYSSLTGLICVGTINEPEYAVFRFRDGTATTIGSSFDDWSFFDVAITSGGDVYVVGDYSKGNIDGVYLFPYYDGSDLLPYSPEDQDLKSTDDRMTEDSDVLYPSQSAVRDYSPMKKITTDTPTVNDDITLGYRVGDLWVDTDG